MILSKKLIILMFTVLIVSCKGVDKKESNSQNQEDNKSNPQTELVEFNYPKTKYQYNFKRTFPFDIRRIKRLNDFENIKKFQINNFSGNDNFWIINGATNKLEEYNLQFNKIKSLGKTGEGPGEFLKPHFIFINKNDILVHDFDQRAIKKLILKDTSIHQYKFKSVLYSPAFLENEKLLYYPSDNNSPNASFIFKVFDFNKKETTSVFHLDDILNLTKVDYMRQVYDGDFRQNKDFSVYFNYCTGMLFVYSNSKNKFISKIETIDKTPPPRAYSKDLGGGYRVLTKDPPFFLFLDAFVDSNNEVFLLNSITPIKNERVVDIYSLKNNNDNAYLYSIKLPSLEDGQKAMRIFKINNTLVVYYDDQTIISYELNK